MELLAIDIGNTSAKVGLFENDTLKSFTRYSSVYEALNSLQICKDVPVIIASVAQKEEELTDIFKDFSQKIIFNQATPIPISNLYDSPQTLGYDRLAACIGANARFPDRSTLVVDIGTAIKYDLVSADNAFIGGIISPGRQMRFQALHTFTKKLPLLEAVDIPPLVGTSTETCIQSGVLNGIVSELNGIIGNYIESYNPVVLLCGGDATYFETQIKYPTFAAPNLVLEGLIRILRYNVAKA